MVSFWDCLLKACVFLLVFPKRNVVHNIIIVIVERLNKREK